MAKYSVITPDRKQAFAIKDLSRNSIDIHFGLHDLELKWEIMQNIIMLLRTNGFQITDLSENYNLGKQGMSQGGLKSVGHGIGKRIQDQRKRKFQLTHGAKQVLEIIKKNGVDYASNIARQLNMDASTVIQLHIARLKRMELIELHKVIQGRKLYKLKKKVEDTNTKSHNPKQKEQLTTGDDSL